MEKDKIKLIIIGGSAGSLEVLLSVLPSLNIGFTIPIVVVLHRKASAETTLVDLLRSKVSLPVHEIEEKERLHQGLIYLAPPDYHLLFEADGSFSLDDSEKVNYSRPSIDVSFESAAGVYGPSLAAVLLSGANNDGTEGCRAVLDHGGITIAQEPKEAEVGYMPASAIAKGNVTYVLNTEGLARFLNGL